MELESYINKMSKNFQNRKKSEEILGSIACSNSQIIEDEIMRIKKLVSQYGLGTTQKIKDYIEHIEQGAPKRKRDQIREICKIAELYDKNTLQVLRIFDELYGEAINESPELRKGDVIDIKLIQRRINFYSDRNKGQLPSTSLLGRMAREYIIQRDARNIPPPHTGLTERQRLGLVNTNS